jgi:hypothetical protein
MAKYVIGSGWWCGNAVRQSEYGSDRIRGRDFHELWYKAVNKFSNPEKIILIDSNSPVKPNFKGKDIEFISLNVNPGHSTGMSKARKYCGWTSSLLMSMQYALLCDCDYFVYLEQDALIYGEGMIEAEISSMESKRVPIAFGNPTKDGFQPIQVSFFIVRKDFIEKVLSRYIKIWSPDSLISPEFKLFMCVHPFLNLIPERILHNSRVVLILKKLISSTFLNVGSGRVRPIQFDSPYFYFQHGTETELEKYIELSGL